MNQVNQTTKRCTYCSVEIPSDAVECKYCGERFVKPPGFKVGTRSVDHIGNTGLYLTFLFGGFILCVFGGIASVTNGKAAPVLIGLGFMALLVALILFFVLFYQVWRFVINESLRNNLVPSIETPAKAVGFCFIPFFNFYWYFQAFGKFTKDFNALVKAKGYNRTITERLGIAIPILIVISIVPFIGYVITGINFLILYPIFINQAVRLCKEIGGNDKPQKEFVFSN